jgi:hypothetical protein
MIKRKIVLCQFSHFYSTFKKKSNVKRLRPRKNVPRVTDHKTVVKSEIFHRLEQI